MFLNRLNIFLALVLLACALGLVSAQAKARKLFVEHERARAQSKQLDVRANELQLQQTQFAKASLIDAKARKEMDMHAVPADRLVHLEQKYSAPSSPAVNPHATSEAPGGASSGARELASAPLSTLSMGER